MIHSKIGKNMQPKTKLADFTSLINHGIGEKVNIAFMKFCYVDINKDTDVDELFMQYADTMASLSRNYPDTRFLAVTVPLTTVKTGIKVWIKKILGRGTSGMLENKKRQEFNEHLRLKYASQNTLFDLAEVESTLPDGSREKYTLDGEEYYSLYTGYTSDGGHLNKRGQSQVAQALLRFLGKL